MKRTIKRIRNLIAITVISMLLLSVIPFNSIDVIAAETNVRSVSEADIPVHTHIWKTKFNDNEHWEECTVCGEIQNKHAHTFYGNGGKKTLCENGYYNQAYRETCGCGYQSKPWVVVHGRYENYTSSRKLNYGNMTSQTLDTIQHISYEEFQDLLNGTNESGKNPDLQKLPATPGGQEYTWHVADDEGLGLIFMGGPVIGNSNGVKGTLELIIGSEGDCGKKVAFHEYFILIKYIKATTNPTREGFISYMENNTANGSLINNEDHMLYGYPEKYRDNVTDEQFERIVQEFKGYYTHSSSWGWGSMNIQHAGHANSGNSMYSNGACYDSSNQHALSQTDGIKTDCDLCGCHYSGNEGNNSDTWFTCSAYRNLADGETCTCGGHALSRGGVRLGTIYCNYKREGTTAYRTSVTVVPTEGFSVVTNTCPENQIVIKTDTTNPGSSYSYYGKVVISNGAEGDALIKRGISCGIVHDYIDNTPPTAYGYVDNLTENEYWKVNGKGTEENPKTQSFVKVTFKDPQDYSRNVVSVKVYDSDRRTIIPQGNDVTVTPLTKVEGTSGDDTLWEGEVNIMTEVNGDKDIYIQAIDSSGRTSELIPMQISYIDAQGPTITVTPDIDDNTWSRAKTLTVHGYDAYKYYAIGINLSDMIQVGNDEYNNERTYVINDEAYGQGRTIRFYGQDKAGNLSYKDYTSYRIDNTKPTVTGADLTPGLHSTAVKVLANDINPDLNASGSGVVKYAISATDETPSDDKFQTSDTFTITQQGYYYLFAKDGVDYISDAYRVYVPTKYNLTINPNNGKYNDTKDNTVVEVVSGETIQIALPTRDGYDFTGWTLEGEESTLTYTGSSSTNFARFTMGIQDTTLVATWAPRDDTKYTVKHWKQNIYDNTNEQEKEEYNLDSNCNDTYYTLADTEEFEGRTDTSVTPDVKSYDGFTSPEKASINIDEDGSAVLNYYYKRNEYNVELTGDAGINLVVGARKYLYDDQVTITSEPKEHYETSGWTGSIVNGEDSSYTFTMPANDVTQNATSNPIDYNISYVGNEEENTTSQAVLPTTPIRYNITTEDLRIRNATRSGFEFLGWIVANDESDFEITTPTQNVVIPKGTHGNLTVKANWEANTDVKYKVQHWKQKVDKDASIYNEENYELIESETFQGTTDTKVTPEVKEYIGFTSPDKQELIIKGDGTAILNYYYTRKYYKLIIDKDENIESVEGEGLHLYGEKVRISCKAKYGYSFKEWEGDAEGTVEYLIMPAADQRIKAISQKNKHEVEVKTGNDTEKIETEYDDEIELEIPEKEGYEFLYFETDDGEKIYDGKLRIKDKDYVIRTVWAKIPDLDLPKTGENDHILLIIYIIITITAFAFAIDLATENKRRK